jgi:hypothetical protein
MLTHLDHWIALETSPARKAALRRINEKVLTAVYDDEPVLYGHLVERKAG